MGNNKVTVNIYGEEYVITGEKPHEEIIKVATYVDSKMQQIGESYKGPTSKLAVLSSINIADEYFNIEAKVEALEESNKELKTDTAHYEQLWEEAKKSFVEYKEEHQLEVSLNKEKIESLALSLNQKERELEALIRNQKSLEKEALKGSAETVAKVEEKYKEIENNFFDLQMENIQLKSELEKLKNKLEWERNEQKGY